MGILASRILNMSFRVQSRNLTLFYPLHWKETKGVGILALPQPIGGGVGEGGTLFSLSLIFSAKNHIFRAKIVDKPLLFCYTFFTHQKGV